MQFPKNQFCLICGKRTGGQGHKACSKEIQKMHADKNREPARKKLGTKTADRAAKHFSKVLS